MKTEDIGLLFDMDGVIMDNHRYHFLSWQKLAEKYEISITEDFYRKQMNGRTFMGIMGVLFRKEISPEKGRQIAYEKEALYRELYYSHLAPTEGLTDFLAAAKSYGIPMVIGTSAPVENVDFTLDGLSIRSYFKGVIDERAVTKGKPDPEVYLKCASLANRIPENCIVFEDAISGIKAGKAAGAKVIALATSHKKEELEADLIVDNFENINLEVIKEVLRS
ncbi:MAG: HAD family phosphatase [Ekhidna sp.]|nr:HAD family phosphatase [Ekhidna sp.]MBC6409027.1 HAD family phosphatase [Ekhidna sp.]MBC6426013.1 HAD family phosphatase [Ekhidna sp.]